MNEKYDFETWKEVQDNEVDYWWIRLNEELKNVANVNDFIENWQDVKDQVDNNTCGYCVHEEFHFNNDEWLEEIYVQIKPLFKVWLRSLYNCSEIDYKLYISEFWSD